MSIVKSVKKIHPEPGEFLIVTLKGNPTLSQLYKIKDEFAQMKFLKGMFIIFVNEQLKIKKSKPKAGKHQVFLNNLEYLEYMSKKGDTECQ